MENHKTTHYAKNQRERVENASETLPTKAEWHFPRRKAINGRGLACNHRET
ncbi:MAG: hypothetical protein ACK5HT_04095 [Draconibacterium sp.]